MNLSEKLVSACGKPIENCTNRELYEALLTMVQQEACARIAETGKKKVYYISAEFLIGKLLSNNQMCIRDRARGINKAFARMCEIAVKEAGETEKKRVIIAHCNCPERAAQVKQEMEKRASFREILITETAGVATMYAGDGGIIMSVEG